MKLFSDDHIRFSHAANVPSPYQPMRPSSASYLPSTPGGQPMTPGADLDVKSPDIGACLLLMKMKSLACLDSSLTNHILKLPFPYVLTFLETYHDQVIV